MNILLSIDIIHGNVVADTLTKIGITLFLSIISGVFSYFKSDSRVTAFVAAFSALVIQTILFFVPWEIIGMIIGGLILIGIITGITMGIKKLINWIRLNKKK